MNLRELGKYPAASSRLDALAQLSQKNTLPVQRQPEIRHPREAQRGPEMHNEESLLRAIFEAGAAGAKGPASLDQLADVRPESFKIAEMPMGRGDIASILNLTRTPLSKLGVVVDDAFFKSHPDALAAYSPTTREVKASSELMNLPKQKAEGILRHEEGHDAFEHLPMEEQIGIEEGLKELMRQVGPKNVGRYMDTPSLHYAPKERQPAEFFAALFEGIGRPNGLQDYIMGVIGKDGLGNTKVTDQVLDILQRAFDTAKASGK
jgi:hypothetical protein